MEFPLNSSMAGVLPVPQAFLRKGIAAGGTLPVAFLGAGQQYTGFYLSQRSPIPAVLLKMGFRGDFIHPLVRLSADKFGGFELHGRLPTIGLSSSFDTPVDVCIRGHVPVVEFAGRTGKRLVSRTPVPAVSARFFVTEQFSLSKTVPGVLFSGSFTDSGRFRLTARMVFPVASLSLAEAVFFSMSGQAVVPMFKGRWAAEAMFSFSGLSMLPLFDGDLVSEQGFLLSGNLAPCIMTGLGSGLDFGGLRANSFGVESRFDGFVLRYAG